MDINSVPHTWNQRLGLAVLVVYYKVYLVHIYLRLHIHIPNVRMSF